MGKDWLAVGVSAHTEGGLMFAGLADEAATAVAAAAAGRLWPIDALSKNTIGEKTISESWGERIEWKANWSLI